MQWIRINIITQAALDVCSSTVMLPKWSFFPSYFIFFQIRNKLWLTTLFVKLSSTSLATSGSDLHHNLPDNLAKKAQKATHAGTPANHSESDYPQMKRTWNSAQCSQEWPYQNYSKRASMTHVASVKVGAQHSTKRERRDKNGSYGRVPRRKLSLTKKNTKISLCLSKGILMILKSILRTSISKVEPFGYCAPLNLP